MLDLSTPLQHYLSTAQPPLISVVVTSYKKAPFLSECVTSIAQQTYPNIEILIVNDGSPDNTIEVAEQLIRAFPERSITLHSKENGGVSDARNFGLRQAHGRLVMTIDGDDKAKPTYLATAIDKLRESGASLFCTNQQNFGGSDSVWTPRHYDPYFIRYDNCIPTPAIYDRLLFERTGGFQRALGYVEDWAFWVSCSQQGLTVCKGDEPLSCYRISDDGLASKHIDGRWQDCVAVVAMANQALYPVDDILRSHAHYPRSEQSSLKYTERLHALHPKDWFGNLLMGLQAEDGRRFQEAVSYYLMAIEGSAQKDWQSLFRLASLIERVSDDPKQKRDVLQLYHAVRILRPDMEREVRPSIEQISKS